MCDDEIHQGVTYDPTVSRRTFGLTAVAATGLAGLARAADASVVEKDVNIMTADGTCDAALFYPAGKGSWPAVVMWPDILGLRPVFREMGRRMAANGYVVLVPNLFYRKAHAPVVDGAFDFAKPEDRAKVMPLAASINAPGAVETDAPAFIAFLDAQPQTDKKKKVGVQGYCMGGPLTFRTAAAVANRVGAAATCHGGGLVTKDATSPHLLIPKTKAAFVLAVAQNDDARDPEAKNVLKAAFAAAGRPADIEVYAADHGWCVKGSAVYNEALAEKAWAKIVALYKRVLV
jgi:carboxymethylenebutenolidase